MGYNGVKTFGAEPATSADMNTYVSDNIDALKNPPSGLYDGDEASDLAVTSTSFIDLHATDGKFQHTITTTGGAVLVTFRCCFTVSATLAAFFDIMVDGVSEGGTDGLFGQTYTAVAGVDGTVYFSHWITGLTADSHVIKARAKVSTGTMTILRQAGGAADVPCQFAVMELGHFA
jgi:hypothetical protein